MLLSTERQFQLLEGTILPLQTGEIQELLPVAQQHQQLEGEPEEELESQVKRLQRCAQQELEAEEEEKKRKKKKGAKWLLFGDGDTSTSRAHIEEYQNFEINSTQETPADCSCALQHRIPVTTEVCHLYFL
jgi:hypothetical protein